MSRAAATGSGGLWLAYELDWPAGATMVLTTATLFLVSQIRRATRHDSGSKPKAN